ncbi:protein D1 isoform X1 [Bemisia tabaci]|uniref:protein D1 isoform X1 n=2 Tax=Bemisia tabaci TaxID=7038 RepID=UPI003B27B4AB
MQHENNFQTEGRISLNTTLVDNSRPTNTPTVTREYARNFFGVFPTTLIFSTIMAAVTIILLLEVYAEFVASSSLGMLAQGPAMSQSHIKTELTKYGIIPDVIDNAPVHVLEVTYGNLDEVYFGEKMDTRACSPPPHTVLWPSDEKKFYTLLMIDPDKPSRANPSEREFLHWLVVNILDDMVLSGDDIAEYVSPVPEPGSGPHRYIFLVFEQPKGKINCTEPFSDIYHDEHRKKFNTKKFAHKYGFGTPEAMTFFIGERFFNETTTESSEDYEY